MIQTVNLHDFRQAFHDCGRGEQFSYEALGLIFDWFEQLEQDTGAPLKLDDDDDPSDLDDRYQIYIACMHGTGQPVKAYDEWLSC